jgi:uncharacterized membrane protein
MHAQHAERSAAQTSSVFYFQANGEIYNHKNIRKQFTGTHNFSTGSDCEVIIPLVSLYILIVSVLPIKLGLLHVLPHMKEQTLHDCK